MSAINVPRAVARRLTFTIGQRLLLGLTPSLLAIALVVALAYYGEFGRQAPGFIVSTSAMLAAVSLALTWWNTRYLVRRMRRLGRGDRVVSGPRDELDRFEDSMVQLRAQLELLRVERDKAAREAARAQAEQATMMAAAVRGMLLQLDEVRLPLHILLNAPFGDLNENQEELLAAANVGADQMGDVLQRLATIADVDRGVTVTRCEPVAMNDILRAILPMVRATAERVGARVVLHLEPAMPRAWGNRSAMAEAMSLLAVRAAERCGTDEILDLRAHSTKSHVEMAISPWRAINDDLAVRTGWRILEAQDATLLADEQTLRVRVARAAPSALSR